jgi:hypothetical protein
MANNPLWYDTAVNGITGNSSCSLNSGLIKIYTGTQPSLDAALTGVLLVTLTFGATAFGASSSAVATANAVASGTAGNTGTAGYFALCESGGAIVMTGTCGTSGCDINMSTVAITSGVTVSCSSFTITG